MTHRVYVRWPDQRTTDKTTTDDEAVARFAFDQLRNRGDLVGQRAGVAWSADNKRRAFHDFATTGSLAMSEPAPPRYAANTTDARNREALLLLQGRAAQLDRQLDQLLLGESVGVGITADALALQLAQVQAALQLLTDKLSTQGGKVD